jgi:hypothetical protein
MDCLRIGVQLSPTTGGLVELDVGQIEARHTTANPPKTFAHRMGHLGMLQGALMDRPQ